MNAEVTYAGATTSATVDSATQVTASFGYGVPSAEADELVIVVFNSTTYSSDYHSDYSNNNVLLSNPLQSPTASP